MKKKLMAIAVALTCLGNVQADEGMWMLNRIDPRTQETMQKLGLKLTAEELYNPDGTSLKDAVVDFGDFCSGVVVSPDGLVFTNHHCGFANIQALSTPEDDILKKGFVARTRAEERPAEGLFVAFLDRTEEVTTRVKAAFDSIYAAHPEAAKTYGRNWKQKLYEENYFKVCDAIEDEYRQANPGMRVELLPYYQGNAFYVSLYRVYNDVRLVFAPSQSLGKFGGDTDNWMWPRQTADFSVFRIYADSLNQPAAYSPDNRPYRPKRYAKVSTEGYKLGDYCMTIGYPGSTDRYLSSFGIRERVDIENAVRIQVRGVKQEVWKEWMNSDRAIGLKYAAKFAQSSNYWKNSIGMNKAIADLGVIEDKQELERQVEKWAGADAERKARFGRMFADLKKAYKQRSEAYNALNFLGESFQGGIELIRLANITRSLIEVSQEGFRARQTRLLNKLYKDYDARVDRETAKALIENYARQMKGKHLPAFYTTIKKDFGGDCRAYVDDLFSRSAIDDGTPGEGLALDSARVADDAAMTLLGDVSQVTNALREQITEASSVISANERLLCQAILEMEQEKPHYSDANFSMRLSYGFVADYTNNGVHQMHYTLPQSLLDKIAQGDENPDYFMEPSTTELLKQANWGPYADKTTGELQLCFLTNNDITGGNSGSPMFNGNGELIGLAFDGNWDAMSSDISFTQSLTRCIGVDIRFVLYLMDRWGGAHHLIEELGVN